MRSFTGRVLAAEVRFKRSAQYCSAHWFLKNTYFSTNLTIGLWISVRSSRYEARGKFGEHERCVRVARVACLFSFLLFFGLFRALKTPIPKKKFSRSSSSVGLLVAMFSLIFCWSFPTFLSAKCRRTVTRGENFFSRHLLADVMKHARAIEFDYSNLLAML